MFAIGFGLLAPLFISVFISISRYWTENFGYNSQDLTMDTVFLLGITEIYIFTSYYQAGEYTFSHVIFGLSASICQIVGTLFMIYSSTHGLAGPTSAMV